MGLRCSINNIADKLCDAVHMLEGNYAIQRDCDRLEKWACVNLMRFNKSKYKVCISARTVLSTNTCWAEHRLRAALRKRTWGRWLMRCST